ncbi:Mch4p KNAG_0A01410 [Huiozyma naganishii CBS 8797]|uniref:Major facilitator superfamily (MFS) profile domain-containing protein n=1 Tax=Huiozyma naganishii (strain ATCC MYA-139 / BCRC 22969 / CBS 8797 / KCTC 17520 / NBRC 10181 / NCYC 3082 / Yp74L-3) TaxID=1071383 RepID=J7QZD9_HUIN7|nr:hypothetical protein KNAG_0A01410 [Kazachstania naganishii CBS 8797]CCK67830.1 hypothetical protein KNAG_0A01410 [Kazachstania naganishii CBS 8797]
MVNTLFPLPALSYSFQSFVQRHSLRGRDADAEDSGIDGMLDDPNNNPEGPSSGFALQDFPENATITKKNEPFEVDNGSHRLHNVVSHELTERDIQLYDIDSDFPDGGWQAYLVVFGSFMGLIPVFGTINSLGAIESYVSKHQLATVSSSTISWIFSLYLAISFISCIFAGSYFDRNGSRGPMIGGSLLYVAGIVALADCHTVWQFILAFSILSGTGTGLLMTPLVSVLATWFFRKRATATSIATIGGSVGGIMFPPILRKLYEEVGFVWAIRIFALICFICLALATLLAKERDKPVSEPFKSKGEIIKWYIQSSFNWRYLLDWKFLFCALGSSLSEASLTSSSTYLAGYSMSVGNSETVSYNLITASNAVGILGRYIPGYLADKWVGRFNIMIITVWMATIFNFVMWLPFGTNRSVLWAYVCLYGFSTGTVLSLTPVCLGQISRTEDFGKRYATCYFLEALITIPIMPIGGALIGKGTLSNYNNLIIFNSAIMGVGAVCFMISRYICVGKKMCKF